MIHKKVYRGQLSFSKFEAQRSQLTAGVGFSLPIELLNDIKSNFSRSAFGFSDSNKFFPGIDVNADVQPKPEDFIDAPFRLLSATMVAGGTWRATDFSKGTILKDSIDKLAGKPVYKDHNTDLDNWVGIVKVPKWTESFTDVKGNKIPAGIDALLSIDAKTNPKIARGVLSGGIFSNSVTVDFNWVPSHDIENQYEFDQKVGQIGEDGRMICREVVEILDYYESSLVWLGADPYAKLIDSQGSLVNPDLTNAYEVENENVRNGYSKEGKYSVSFSTTQGLISLSRLQATKNNNNMEPILEALRLALGIGVEVEVTPAMVATLSLTTEPDAAIARKVNNFERLSKVALASADTDEVTPIVAAGEEAEVSETISEELVALKKADLAKLKASANTLESLKIGDAPVTQEALTSLQAEAGKVTSLTAELAKATEDKNTAEASLAAELPFAIQGKSFVAKQQNEAIRLYKLSAGEKASEAVEKLFKEAKPEAVEGLLNQYAGSVTAAFNGRCKKCESTDFEFKSSFGTGLDGKKPDEVIVPTPEEAVSFNALHNKYDKKSNNI